jgi:hypothetical protein
MTPLIYAIDSGWPVARRRHRLAHVDKAMENHDSGQPHHRASRTAHQMIVAGSTCNEVGLETMIRGHKANIYLGGANCDRSAPSASTSTRSNA